VFDPKAQVNPPVLGQTESFGDGLLSTPTGRMAFPLPAAVNESASAPRFGPDYIAHLSNNGARRGIWKYANRTATELWGDAIVERVGRPASRPTVAALPSS
jgi:hypothetical protein